MTQNTKEHKIKPALLPIILAGVARVLHRTVSTSLKVTALIAMMSPLTSSRVPTIFESIQNSGELIVLSRNGPTTFYENSSGYTGFEYILLKKFAKYLGVTLKVETENDLGTLLKQIDRRGVYFAAAGLTVTEQRKEHVKFSTPYMQVSQQVLYRAGEKRPRKVEDLIGKNILVLGNSAHSENLRRLQRKFPNVKWKEAYDTDALELMEMVHSKKIDYTIVDSNSFQINSGLYPKVKVGFNIREPEDVAWAFPKGKDETLYQKAQIFLEKSKKNGFLADTEERFYGHVGEINRGGAVLFSRRMKTRLPKWEKLLKSAGEKEGLDWHLLAAHSYQEAHWYPKARSHTGVRGFMMLTRRTSKQIGVKNRLNATQSIFGGAKYFKSLHRRISKDIVEPDRTWFALASYNVGLGHVNDARKLAKKEGKNPNKWADVREILPLLAKRKYYKETKHGYARGWEAVQYVQNIRSFYTIITWNKIETDRLEQISLSDAVDRNEKDDSFTPAMIEAMKNITTTSGSP